MDANRLAFRQWKVYHFANTIAVDILTELKIKIIPRMLRPTPVRDLSVELFGQKQSSPVLFAPLGVQAICHPDKEIGVAEVAAEIGVPFVFSTAASSNIEEVAKANGKGTRWYQLYWPQDHEITASVCFFY